MGMLEEEMMRAQDLEVRESQAVVPLSEALGAMEAGFGDPKCLHDAIDVTNHNTCGYCGKRLTEQEFREWNCDHPLIDAQTDNSCDSCGKVFTEEELANNGVREI